MLELFQHYQTMIHANPVLEGAFGLWGLSVITYLARNVPLHLMELVSTYLTTSLEFNNSENGYSEMNYLSFLVWFEKNKLSKWSRTMALDSGEGGRRTLGGRSTGVQCGIGEGYHFFFYKGRFYWLYRNKIDKPGVSRMLYNISIHTFGINKNPLLSMLEEFKYSVPEDKTGIFLFDEYDWDYQLSITPRTINTVIIKKQIKDDLLGVITKFLGSADWYASKGMAYKKTFILHGVPGTGKTSLIKALAQYFDRNLCILNISTMNDGQFAQALSRVPKKSFLVIEDCDSSQATQIRDEQPDTPIDHPLRLSLTGVLNALDGILSLHDTVIFLTTNALDSLDPAFIRKGRVDHVVEIPLLTDTEVREYIDLMFPGHEYQWFPFNDILGCDLQALYFEHPDDPGAFIKSIPVKG